MRRLRWSLLALAFVPTLAWATPEGASADKRMLLFRTAIGRDNCPQARDVAQSMLIDFPEDAGVRLLIAQVLACEGKWVEAYTPMMAAKAAGLEVAEVEAKILANVAIVEVTVTVEGGPPPMSIAIVAYSGGERWEGWSEGVGRYVFAVPDKPIQFQVANEEGSPFTGMVVPQEYPKNHRTSVDFALRRRPSLSMRRPDGLDPSIALRVNGLLLEASAREVAYEQDTSVPLHFQTDWTPSGGKALTKTWSADITSPHTPWAYVIRMPDGAIVAAGLLAPGESASVDAMSNLNNGGHQKPGLANAFGSIRILGKLPSRDGRVVEVDVPIERLAQGRSRLLRRRLVWSSALAGTGAAGFAVGAIVYTQGASHAANAMDITSIESWDVYAQEVAAASEDYKISSQLRKWSWVSTGLSLVPWVIPSTLTIDIGDVDHGH